MYNPHTTPMVIEVLQAGAILVLMLVAGLGIKLAIAVYQYRAADKWGVRGESGRWTSSKI